MPRKYDLKQSIYICIGALYLMIGMSGFINSFINHKLTLDLIAMVGAYVLIKGYKFGWYVILAESFFGLLSSAHIIIIGGIIPNQLTLLAEIVILYVVTISLLLYAGAPKARTGDIC